MVSLQELEMLYKARQDEYNQEIQRKSRLEGEIGGYERSVNNDLEKISPNIREQYGIIVKDVSQMSDEELKDLLDKVTVAYEKTCLTLERYLRTGDWIE